MIKALVVFALVALATAHAQLILGYGASPLVVPAVAPAAGYVAVNRGAVHVAPLPGRAVGSAHVNLVPAPGTI